MKTLLHSAYNVLFKALVALVIILFFYVIYQEISGVYDHSYWSSHRMFFSYALANADTLYSSPKGGLFIYHLYGPVFPTFFLPATLFSEGRTVVNVGAILSFICIFGTATIWYFLMAGKTQHISRNWRSVTVGWVLLLFAFYCDPAIKYVGFNVHADSVALSLGMLGLVFSGLYLSKGSLACLFISGMLIALAVFTKQTTLLFTLVPIVMFLFKGISFRTIRDAVLFLSPLLIFGTVFTWMYGPDLLYINMVSMAKNHPLRIFTYGADNLYLNPDVFSIISAGQSFMEKTVILAENLLYILKSHWFILTLSIVFLFDSQTESQSRFSGILKRILGFTICVMMIASLLGISKAGGDINSMAYLVFPVFVLLSNHVTYWLQRNNIHPVVFILLLLIPIGVLAGRAYKLYGYTQDKPDTTLGDRVFEFCRVNPGFAYFPTRNFEQFRAEGAIYPVSDTLFNFDLARIELDTGVYEDVLPKNVKFVVIDNNEPGYVSIVKGYKSFENDILVVSFEEFEELVSSSGMRF